MLRRSWYIVLAALAGCRLNFDERTDGFFHVGGVVAAPSVNGLVLQLNGDDDLAIASPGPFSFATPLPEGSAYAVTMKTPPTGFDCVMSHASGTVTATSAGDVEVTCFDPGTCPAATIEIAGDETFVLPTGCAQLTVEVLGGGGAGGAKNAGDAAAAGGAGGRAVKTLTQQAPGTMYRIAIGRGGTCESTATTPGGYAGGRGGVPSGFGNGGLGAGASAPPGGLGGSGSTGSQQPGGAGGNGGYGGGGGGGGGDVVRGNSGGGATVFALVSPATELVIAGGGGGAGAADQNGDRAGAGGNACNGMNGVDGTAAVAGTRSGGGGGGGACFCLGGCDAVPTSTGGEGGIAGQSGDCATAQNGAAGSVIITLQ